MIALIGIIIFFVVNASFENELKEMKVSLQASKNETNKMKLKYLLEREMFSFYLSPKDPMMIICTSEENSFWYLLKPDGTKIAQGLYIPESTDEYPYLYGSISALIRGIPFIFGGYEYGNHHYRVSQRLECTLYKFYLLDCLRGVVSSAEYD